MIVANCRQAPRLCLYGAATHRSRQSPETVHRAENARLLASFSSAQFRKTASRRPCRVSARLVGFKQYDISSRIHSFTGRPSSLRIADSWLAFLQKFLCSIPQSSLPDFIRDPTISADCFRRLLETYRPTSRSILAHSVRYRFLTITALYKILLTYFLSCMDVKTLK